MSTLTILVRHRMRRDRIQVPIWLASLTALLLFSALALQDTFGGLEERTLLVQLAVANPAVMFIRGVTQGTDAAAVLIFTVLAFLGVLVALMNTFLDHGLNIYAEDYEGKSALDLAPIGGYMEKWERSRNMADNLEASLAVKPEEPKTTRKKQGI